MDIEFKNDYIKQEENATVKEESLDVLNFNNQSQVYAVDNVGCTSSPNVIVLRRPAEESAGNNGIMSMPPPLTHFRRQSPIPMMPPPLAQLKRKSTVTKFSKKASSTSGANKTYERRRVVAHERTVDVMNRMANSLSAMASTLPLLAQEIIKVRKELEAIQAVNKKS